MIAVQYRKSVPRYLALKAVGPRWGGVYTSGVSPVALRDVPEPSLPTDAWVRVRPRLTGVCGSDLATICAKGSPYLSPLVSMPFVLGHEVVGAVTHAGDKADGVAVGDRVVLQPALGCCVRGITPACDACAGGHIALCRNVTRGDIAPGIQTGYCRDTGGGWSEGFVAHPSQLIAVPDAMDDEIAVLVEPFACALHGLLRGEPKDDDRVLIVGGGTIGLLTLAALRAIECRAHVTLVARHAHQREHAERLGADRVLTAERDMRRRYAALADAFGADVFQPDIGKPTVVGGADLVYDCVASSESIDDCARFTRAGGALVLVGMPAIPRGVDWTSIWFKELNVRAAYAYGRETFRGEQISTFALALRLMSQCAAALRPLVGEPFALADYRTAIRAALHTRDSRSVKTLFRVPSA